MTLNRFGQAGQGQTWREELCPGAVVLLDPSGNGADLAVAGVRRIRMGFSFLRQTGTGFMQPLCG
jgi:hypothetical protein